MTDIVNLNVARWLQLCDLADAAANDPHAPPDQLKALAVAAGRLTTVHALPHSLPDTSLTGSLRWDCTAFAHAGAITRAILAPGLLAKSQLVRLLLVPHTPLVRVALPVPAPEPEPVPPPAWARRADIGG